MFKQTLSGKNLRIIFDKENRKGKYLEGLYFPKAVAVSSQIQQLRKDIKELIKIKSTLSSVVFSNKLDYLNSSIETKIKEREEILNSEMEIISNNILNKNFNIQLTRSQTPQGMSIYKYNASAETYLALKKIQQNINSTYHVKQNDRDLIISQLKSILSDSLPKHIIRTDIKSFYESIPCDEILSKLRKDALLTNTTRRIISNLFTQYKKLSSSNIGLPRGVGISAYLAELYMRDFDAAIQRDENLIYYARYVDDIIIIYARHNSFNKNKQLSQIRKTLNEMHLELNESKTNCSDSPHFNFEYLGYKITGKPKKKLLFDLSSNKYSRYKSRIDEAFREYIHTKNRAGISARKLLVNRVKYLTGNTRLTNNKKNVYVGIYFSNKHLTDETLLVALDNYLTSIIANLNNTKLEKTLRKYTYISGFRERTFHRFNTDQLESIVRAWN